MGGVSGRSVLIRCGPGAALILAWSHVQQDLALHKAVWANAWSVNISMSSCMVRRTSRIPDCGSTATNELMMEKVANGGEARTNMSTFIPCGRAEAHEQDTTAPMVVSGVSNGKDLPLLYI